MRIAMTGVVNKLSTSLSSHNAGWTYATKSCLETYFNQEVDILKDYTKYNDYDVLVINEGVNYRENVFNFFGGVQEDQVLALESFSGYQGELYCVNTPVDYNILLTKRKELQDLDITFRIPKVIDITQVSDKLVLGDSHSVSVYNPGYGISRNDGKTLHGFLKIGIKNFIPDTINHLIFYAGNIDVRFHFCRFGHENMLSKLYELEKQLLDLNLESITLVKLIPIEDESRKLPKTGLYKGEKFFGTREERSLKVKLYNQVLETICHKNGWNILSWPFDYENFSFDDMEARQSVHLRPSSYMFKNKFIRDDRQVLELF